MPTMKGRPSGSASLNRPPRWRYERPAVWVEMEAGGVVGVGSGMRQSWVGGTSTDPLNSEGECVQWYGPRSFTEGKQVHVRLPVCRGRGGGGGGGGGGGYRMCGSPVHGEGGGERKVCVWQARPAQVCG